jgi:hypothetical protein
MDSIYSPLLQIVYKNEHQANSVLFQLTIPFLHDEAVALVSEGNLKYNNAIRLIRLFLW